MYAWYAFLVLKLPAIIELWAFDSSILWAEFDEKSGILARRAFFSETEIYLRNLHYVPLVVIEQLILTLFRILLWKSAKLNDWESI